jgi:hypothetical protein
LSGLELINSWPIAVLIVNMPFGLNCALPAPYLDR